MTDYATLANAMVKRRRQPSAKVAKILAAKEQEKFFAALIADDLPLPVPEYRFAAPRRWKFDYAWRREYGFADNVLVALEVEGGAWTQGRHTRGGGFIADMEKYNEAAVRGWCVIRVTPSQLTAPQTIALIRRALAR